MSFNRENVTWQNADGTWNMAFYVVAWVDEDGDEEWDVEYNYDCFYSYDLATKAIDPDEAYRIATARTSNPGGSYVVPREGNEEECDRYDRMLLEALGRVRA